ncbi:MAG: hypothetical protein L6U61_07850 [Bacteroidales bacterium]|nr:MAG: hypothetical protein L6U61_07850 [Bacteroidales bacterium]
MQKKLKSWIEATRLRTLPVSTAGVVVASGCAYNDGSFKWQPALLCFLFAVLAQVASNFANEYFDYVNGSDKKDAKASAAVSPKATSRRGQCCAPRLAPLPPPAPWAAA